MNSFQMQVFIFEPALMSTTILFTCLLTCGVLGFCFPSQVPWLLVAASEEDILSTLCTYPALEIQQGRLPVRLFTSCAAS